MEKLQEEQIRVCTEVAQSCLTYDPVKRPSAQCIIDILKKTEPQASSLVESQTKSPRNSFRIEAIWHSDPDNVARALKAVTESICLFYARDTAKVPLQELYRLITSPPSLFPFVCPVDNCYISVESTGLLTIWSSISMAKRCTRRCRPP